MDPFQRIRELEIELEQARESAKVRDEAEIERRSLSYFKSGYHAALRDIAGAGEQLAAVMGGDRPPGAPRRVVRARVIDEHEWR